ncbi:MAG: AraC family transcriptional regulator [Eubacteriales bacterium]|nr:AraC family transcriptional regulator [Eubacteriales bacterium]
MNLNIDNLKLISVLKPVSPQKIQIPSRPSHAYVFRESGAVDYDFAGFKTRQEAGEVLIIPKGTAFTANLVGNEESRYTVINFDGDFSITKAMKLNLGSEALRIFAILDNLAAMDHERDIFWMLSGFYEITARLLKTEQADYHTRETLSLMEPALKLLRHDLFNPTLKVSALHEACGISDTYFRTLFTSQFGVSPKKYILDRRLIHAKQLLDSGECSSVGDAAELSGFEDPLYFSRVFKNRYGYPPSLDLVK